MNVAYKVIKPFGCAKIGDIFNFDSDDREFVMEDTKTTKKGTNSRFMSINEEYVDALVKGGNLEPYGSEVAEVEEETLPTIAELKLIALEAFINDCKTKYALIVDSDIEFRKRIGPLFDMFIKEGAALMGEVCGSRGGYNLYNRVHPWFMFVDIENIQKHGIRFYDEKRIEETDSCHFYQAVPMLLRYDDVWRYDVGATFYEDVINAGLKVSNYKAEPEYFIHFEGMSWQDKSNHTWLMQHYQQVRNLLYMNRQTKAYFKIRIDGCFV